MSNNKQHHSNDANLRRRRQEEAGRRQLQLLAARKRIDTLETGLNELEPFSTKSVSDRVTRELAALSIKCIAVVLVAVCSAYVVVSCGDAFVEVQRIKAVEIAPAK